MIKIRRMEPEDRGIIYEILQQTDMFIMPEINLAMELIDTYLFNKEQEDYTLEVAEDETGNVVGYVCFGPTPATDGTFDLYWIAVSPEMQNKGVGKKLLSHVEDEVVQANARMLVIETSSQPKYVPTQQFYLRTDYILEARIKDFYKRGDDKLIFVKRFNSSSR